MPVVVDTNVAVVAERLADQADEACIDASTLRLLAVQEAGDLLLDQDDAIVFEYTSTLGHAGQPGVGRAFVKWAWDYRFDSNCVKRIAITERRDGQWRQFEEFPDLPALATFDKSDQKFVAIAVASQLNPSILHALDSDWRNHRDAFVQAGIIVECLCPHLPCNS